MTSFHILFTIVLFVIFIAIAVWAYSDKRKKDFTEAEQLPFVDEQPGDRA